MKAFTIGEVAKRTGLAPSALRYYESIGVVPRPARLNGRRIYDQEWLKWLGVVLLAQEAGCSMQEIRTLVNQFSRKTPPSKRWTKLARRRLEEVGRQIERARRMERLLLQLLECRCPSLQDCGSIGLEHIERK